MNDLRLALRMLPTNPGFSLVVIGLLSVGIGSSTLIFSAVNAILLRPLPVRNPENLVRIVTRLPMIGTSSQFNAPFYEALRDHSSSFSAVFGEGSLDVALTDPGPPEQIRIHLPTPNFFQALGVSALYGRTLLASDAKSNSDTPPALLSYGFWRRRFNGDPHAVGKTIALGGHTFIIVGVMPLAFNGIAVDTAPDVRVPLRMSSELSDFGAPGLDLGARLNPGVTLARAQSECLRLWRSRMKAGSDNLFESRAVLALDPLERGTSILRDRYGLTFKLLLAGVGLLLLLVCANVAGLFLVRGMSRRQEIAIRLAVGASRLRLVRQMLTESALLTCIGTAGGVLLYGAFRMPLIHALPPMRDITTARLTLSVDFGLDLRVLLFALGVSIFTNLLFGLAPAISLSSISLDSVLRSIRSSSRSRARQILVVLQVALCTMLLCGAGLLLKTFERLLTVDPGFDRNHVVTFTADPSLIRYKADREIALIAALSRKVAELPGVQSVAVAQRALMRGRGIGQIIAPAGRSVGASEFLNTSINVVTPEYFDTMGMRLLAGHSLAAIDTPEGKPVSVLVNQAFAKRFFPDEDSVGERFGRATATRAAAADFEIVGVVSDAKYRSLREPVPPTYFPLFAKASGAGSFVLHVRTRRAPESVILPVQRILASLDPQLPFTEIHTLDEEVNASIAGERLTATLASSFGLIAAFLTAVGIYGLLAYAVSQQRREIGIRIAIGATPANIGMLFGRQMFLMVTGGMVLGLAATLLATPWIRSVLYNVQPGDPASLAAACLFVALIGMVATAVPAFRAMRIEPGAALRDE